MAFSELYRRQVALLLRIVPAVAAENCFALKGGTAINLFVRDLPRLSVDIDLTYLPVQPRDESLAEIDAALRRIAAGILRTNRRARIVLPPVGETIRKLVVREDATQVKIEVTPVLRGCVYEPELRSVMPAVEDAFGFAEIQVVSFADLYAGKIVAALDRQHPRDLFDVMNLFAEEGVGDALRNAFIVYLISHNRPMAEVLAPRLKPLADEFARGFDGMAAEPVALESLEASRLQLIDMMVGGMPAAHREFLIGFEVGAPDWSLLPLAGVSDLPAVRWRQQNLDTLAAPARAAAVDQLRAVLGSAA